MNKSILLTGLACLALITSACSDSGGGGGVDPKKAPNPQEQNRNGAVNPANQQGQMTEEQAELVEIVAIEEAMRRELPIVAPQGTQAVLIIKPNVYVRFNDGNKQRHRSTLPNSEALTYIMLENRNTVITMARVLWPDVVPNFGDEDEASEKSEEEIVSIPNDTEGQVVFDEDESSTGDYVIIPDDSDLEVTQENDLRQEEQAVPELHRVEPIETIDNISPRSSDSTGLGLNEPEKVDPISYWKYLDGYSKEDQLKLNCMPFADAMADSILETVAPADLAQNESALIGLRCLARHVDENGQRQNDYFFKLYNKIVTKYRNSMNKTMLVFEAIDSPIYAIMVTKQDKEKGLDLLRTINEFSYQNKMNDINLALFFMDYLAKGKNFDKSTKRKILSILTDKLLNYSSDRDKKISTIGLGQILSLHDEDSAGLRSFMRKVLKRNPNTKKMEFFRAILLAKAKNLTVKDCKVYELTSKQQAAIQKTIGWDKLQKLLKVINEKKTNRSGSGFEESCSINS